MFSILMELNELAEAVSSNKFTIFNPTVTDDLENILNDSTIFNPNSSILRNYLSSEEVYLLINRYRGNSLTEIYNKEDPELNKFTKLFLKDMIKLKNKQLNGFIGEVTDRLFYIRLLRRLTYKYNPLAYFAVVIVTVDEHKLSEFQQSSLKFNEIVGSIYLPTEFNNDKLYVLLDSNNKLAQYNKLTKDVKYLNECHAVQLSTMINSILQDGKRLLTKTNHNKINNNIKTLPSLVTKLQSAGIKVFTNKSPYITVLKSLNETAMILTDSHGTVPYLVSNQFLTKYDIPYFQKSKTVHINHGTISGNNTTKTNSGNNILNDVLNDLATRASSTMLRRFKNNQPVLGQVTVDEPSQLKNIYKLALEQQNSYDQILNVTDVNKTKQVGRIVLYDLVDQLITKDDSILQNLLKMNEPDYVHTPADIQKIIKLFQLDKYRSFGSNGYYDDVVTSINNNKDSIECAEIVKEAFAAFPTRWLRDNYNLNHKNPIKTKLVPRGYCDVVNHTICLNTDDDSDENPTKSIKPDHSNIFGTAIHELAHWFAQQYTDEINKGQETLFKILTTNSNTYSLNDLYSSDTNSANKTSANKKKIFSDNELATPDNFNRSYTGKSNGIEIISTGMETLFINPIQLFKNLDIAEWILGTLVTVGSSKTAVDKLIIANNNKAMSRHIVTDKLNAIIPTRIINAKAITKLFIKSISQYLNLNNFVSSVRVEGKYCILSLFENAENSFIDYNAKLNVSNDTLFKRFTFAKAEKAFSDKTNYIRFTDYMPFNKFIKTIDPTATDKLCNEILIKCFDNFENHLTELLENLFNDSFRNRTHSRLNKYPVYYNYADLTKRSVCYSVLNTLNNSRIGYIRFSNYTKQSPKLEFVHNIDDNNGLDILKSHNINNLYKILS